MKPENEDEKIFKTAVNLKSKIYPMLPHWLEKKINRDLKDNLNEIYKSILLEPRFDLRVNNYKQRDNVIKLLKKNDIISKKSNFSPLCISLLKRITIIF